MRNRLNGHSVPNLVVARRVIERMTAAAGYHIEDETGEAMVGLVVPGTHTNGVPTLYVLDTISPDDSAVRQFHTFQQGDEHQDELIWWLQENWQQTRLQHPSVKWDVPLRYLGDWHKQPGFMIAPSGGDLMTALSWLDDPENKMDFLLAPIVTLGHPHTIGVSSSANFLMSPQPDGTALRVDFWYIDKQSRIFLPITPTLYPDGQLPTLVEYPWHLLNEERFSTEMRQLEADGLLITLVLWDADNQPPLEICFLTARVGADKLLLLITEYDFPNSAPKARIAPFVQLQADEDLYTVFANAWAQSEAVHDSFAWTPESTLLDYVHALEAQLGLNKPETKKPEETS